MKKFSLLLIVSILLLNLCACAGSDNDIKNNWQEQYDLGVRYLSEGNYQEAIIAFTAAIEIDAKQVATYEKIFEAYCALGEFDNARAMLEKGIENTNDDGLREIMDAFLIEQDTLTTPKLPERLNEELGLYRPDRQVVASDELLHIFSDIISAGLEHDRETTLTLLMSEDLFPKVDSLVDRVWDTGTEFWMDLNGALLYYDYSSYEDDGVYTSINFDYRQENGTAFFLHYSNFGDNAWQKAITFGNTVDYQLNGDFTGYTESMLDLGDGDHDFTSSVYQGSAKDELLHGELVETQQGFFTSTTYEVYDDGYIQPSWSGDDGALYTQKVVREDGEVVYYDSYFIESQRIVQATALWGGSVW